jgi:peptide/nickel transport system permease protein
MRADYVLKRFAAFLLIMWLAGTINFILPRMTGQNAVRDRLMEQAVLGGAVQAGLEEMVRQYDIKFGLDKPLIVQYGTYLSDIFRFEFNYSMSNYPRKVIDMIREALPWTIGLLFMTTIISFAIGTLLGAILGWPRAPSWLNYLMPPLLALDAIPFFLLGMILIYIFSFQFSIFPIFGGYTSGSLPSFSLSFIIDLIRHATLPALSIILVSIGSWAIGMRAMMVTTTGEDYITFADAKGLRGRTIFLRYGIRNALLPQTTALALAFGRIVSGGVLVEAIFGYPGIGNVLFNAIRQSDYFLMQGILFIVILSLGIATLTLDLIYPLLDPRITYRRS